MNANNDSPPRRSIKSQPVWHRRRATNPLAFMSVAKGHFTRPKNCEAYLRVLGEELHREPVELFRAEFEKRWAGKWRQGNQSLDAGNQGCPSYWPASRTNRGLYSDAGAGRTGAGRSGRTVEDGRPGIPLPDTVLTSARLAKGADCAGGICQDGESQIPS
jgi:hypothetical protein